MSAENGDTTRSILAAFYVRSLSIKTLPDGIRAWITIAAMIAAICFVVCTIFSGVLLVRLGWEALWGRPPTDQEIIKNFLLAFASSFGIPFLIWRTWTAHRQANAAFEQARVALENHITGIFSKSVELMGFIRESTTLGADKTPVTRSVPNIEARLGALYSLERLLLESEKDQRAILETICAYIRENSPLEIPDDETEAAAFSRGERPPTATRRADVQAAITIIGRRPESVRVRGAAEGWRLDLRNANLVAYDFSNLNLGYTDFENSFLNFAKLSGGQFAWCSFKRTHLRAADLTSASFEHSTFDDCDVRKAKIENTDFRSATFTKVDLRNATVISLDVRGANLTNAFNSMLDYLLMQVKEKGETGPYDAGEFLSIYQLFKKSMVDENTSVSQTVHDIIVIMTPRPA